MTGLNNRLQQLLDASVTEGAFAGVNLLVLRHGEELAYAQAGYADLEQRRPYRRDTIARIYSMTKPVTAAAAMILMERGQLDLAMHVGDAIAEFRDVKVWEQGRFVPPKRGLLVRDLLSMTSGLSYGGGEGAGRNVTLLLQQVEQRRVAGDPMTTRELAGKIAACGLSFHPGERWMYGLSADILGAVIEAVSGVSFGTFLRRELFDPLGMADTGFYVPTEKQHRLAQVYERASDGLKRYPTNNLGVVYEMSSPPAFESGGAGLVSTLDDYAKFASMLQNRGSWQGTQILKPATVDFFTHGALTPWQQTSMYLDSESHYGCNYGNLMRVMETPGMAHYMAWEGEYGWDGWLGTYFSNSPHNGVTILLTCQRRDSGITELTRRLHNVLVAELT